MWNKLLFVAVCVLSISRESSAVVSDFAPRIAELHQRYSDFEFDANGHKNDVLSSVGKIMEDYARDMNSLVSETAMFISSEEKKIIDNNGLTGQTEIIERCMNESAQGLSEVFVEGNARRDLCLAFGNQKLTEAMELSQPMFEKLREEHNRIDSDALACEKEPTDYEALKCLIAKLFEFQTGHITDLINETQFWTTSIYRKIGETGQMLMGSCLKFNEGPIRQRGRDVVSEFENCVQDVINSKIK